MPRINGETVINRPRVEVFDFVADERNHYDPRIRHTELLSTGPDRCRDRFRATPPPWAGPCRWWWKSPAMTGPAGSPPQPTCR
jgi:hypothetical protein